MKKDKDLYRVVVSGREVDVEKVHPADIDFATAKTKAVHRITEAMKIMREQEADPAKLDATHYFVGVEAAKEFARMCFKDIEERVTDFRDHVEHYDGRADTSETVHH